MKVTQEKLPASQLGLEIEIPSEMSRDAYEKTLQEFKRSVKVPGFRKGKVPRQVLIQRFGSERLKAAVLEELVEDGIRKAVEQEDIEAIGNFQLRSSFEDLLKQFEPGAALTFSAAVDVQPEATLTQYKGLEVKAEEVQYDPQNVENILSDYQNRVATQVPVEDRAAQIGDIAIVDFVGRLTGGDSEADSEEDSEAEDESREIPGGSAEDFQIELQSDRFIEGFVDGIVGMNPGETRELSVTFPDDYPQQELAGKPAVFTVTLKDLKEKELPELDDDFAQEVSEFETMDELRKSLESRYQEEAQQQTKSNKEDALTEALVDQLSVELPETLIRREVDFLVTQTAMQLENQGLDIRKMLTPELIEQMRARSRPEAITRLRRTLALGEVAKQESIQVEPDAVKAKVDEIMANLSDRDVDRDRLIQVVEEDLLKEKILAWLEEHATVELVPEGSLQPEEAESTENVTPESEPESEPDASSAVVDVEASTEVTPSEADNAEPERPETSESSAPSGKKTTQETSESTEPESLNDPKSKS
ncbi:MAG: trigger factor [Elainellaceae cyanobacterium]